VSSATKENLERAVVVICAAVATQSDLIEGLSRRIDNLSTMLSKLKKEAKSEENDQWFAVTLVPGVNYVGSRVSNRRRKQWNGWTSPLQISRELGANINPSRRWEARCNGFLACCSVRLQGQRINLGLAEESRCQSQPPKSCHRGAGPDSPG
jgi:hypothetical protein